VAGNDGKGVYPFADDCNRIENGTHSANVPTPPGETRPDTEDRRKILRPVGLPPAVRSGLAALRHPHPRPALRSRRSRARDSCSCSASSTISAGNTRTFQIPNGRTRRRPDRRQPWTWQIAEAFQIRKGLIHQIQATMERVPYGMNSGWSSWEDGMSSRARDVARGER
jgi:hypothetical protein